MRLLSDTSSLSPETCEAAAAAACEAVAAADQQHVRLWQLLPDQQPTC